MPVNLDKKATILILEDAEFNQLIYKKFLSPYYEIYICKNDIQFYEELEKRIFDLFIMDISLPNSKSGIELIEELRETEKYKTTPIVVITAQSQKSIEKMAIEAGTTKFILKPIENKQILNELKNLLTF